ncbi:MULTISPECIES: carbohydrate ABC transporter permease [Thermoanaerobacterium]|uniref:Carbohydrate ABC transporter membrane protein 2, CUT1 family n=1 Tax=Thermoanaerobacterium thermosaccharolyticum M0795 TaxID=698948 RepID=L0IF16_THETR|nr:MULTISPECIES: carbohydrate ABC transporter permease [Thermoanaerobacterium]AGB18150.1 carbohydrate ABC transporter membrane protein 2, CUT1 family [Thermoanaerobacterium thermosaccharolyticum M0795]SNX54410.1 raffinose/stachyose/melibiose transport system permease protein [Thermoanaerobacterium sp. RBIITD]
MASAIKTKIKLQPKVYKYILLTIVTFLVILPFLWMFLMSFKSNSEIFANPLGLPKSLSLINFKHAIETLDFLQLYKNTFFIVVVTMIIELPITFSSSFVLSKMTFQNKKLKSIIYGFLISGLTISPFILLFPVYRINTILHLKEQMGLVMPYIASSISFNTLLFVGYLKSLPLEIDEAAIIDGCSLWQLIIKVIVPMAKPVIATVVIFNVLYIWNEFPFASVILHKPEDYTLSLGASFFKGKYNIDYAGIIASSVMIIIPQLVFYGILQKNIIDGITAGAIKG